MLVFHQSINAADLESDRKWLKRGSGDGDYSTCVLLPGTHCAPSSSTAVLVAEVTAAWGGDGGEWRAS
jgi:hypothetical protein